MNSYFKPTGRGEIPEKLLFWKFLRFTERNQVKASNLSVAPKCSLHLQISICRGQRHPPGLLCAHQHAAGGLCAPHLTRCTTVRGAAASTTECINLFATPTETRQRLEMSPRSWNSLTRGGCTLLDARVGWGWGGVWVEGGFICSYLEKNVNSHQMVSYSAVQGVFLGVMHNHRAAEGWRYIPPDRRQLFRWSL